MAGAKIYSTPRWRRLRLIVLHRDGYHCRHCGVSVSGKGQAHVDHIIKRTDRPELTFDINNLQSLCSHCHNSIKQREERTGQKIIPIGQDGFPIGSDWARGGDFEVEG